MCTSLSTFPGLLFPTSDCIFVSILQWLKPGDWITKCSLVARCSCCWWVLCERWELWDGCWLKGCPYAQINIYFLSSFSFFFGGGRRGRADLPEDPDNVLFFFFSFPCHGLLKHLEFQFWYFFSYFITFLIYKMSVLLTCVGNGYGWLFWLWLLVVVKTCQ